MTLIDVIRTGATLVEDGTDGLNAAIVQVNTAKSTSAPAFGTIKPKKAPMATRVTAFPAFFQLPDGGNVGELNQGKRKNVWLLQWHALWRGEEQDYEIMAVTLEAMVIVLERLEGRGTIARVDNVSVASTGFHLGQQPYTLIQLAFRVQERDEDPLS